MSAINLRWTRASFWLGSLLLIITVAIIYVGQEINDITAVGVLLGVLLMLSSFFDFIGASQDARDERARRIGTMAATWSWYVTIAFTGMVLVFSYWNGREFTTTQLLSTIVFIMAASMVVANTILNLKGDVE
jgi:NADH:ubiquinone oxidoreductase subunit 6 (subunit J)